MKSQLGGDLTIVDLKIGKISLHAFVVAANSCGWVAY